ncbi:hypothetical protein VUR80DRAFT_4436 [Thermomyces stellatus]
MNMKGAVYLSVSRDGLAGGETSIKGAKWGEKRNRRVHGFACLRFDVDGRPATVTACTCNYRPCFSGKALPGRTASFPRMLALSQSKSKLASSRAKSTFETKPPLAVPRRKSYPSAAQRRPIKSRFTHPGLAPVGTH